ncbi:hypothetical protein MTO96_003333 [Rhipicephalus appendiculatus]
MSPITSGLELCPEAYSEVILFPHEEDDRPVEIVHGGLFEDSGAQVRSVIPVSRRSVYEEQGVQWLAAPSTDCPASAVPRRVFQLARPANQPGKGQRPSVALLDMVEAPVVTLSPSGAADEGTGRDEPRWSMLAAMACGSLACSTDG